MSAILRDDPPEPSRAVAEVPPPIDRIVRRCLEKSPAERFQSASDLAYAIEETFTAFAGQSAGAAPLSGPRPAYRSIVIALVAVAAVAALIAFDIGGIRRRLTGGTSPQAIRSLAVLPLENLSRDPEQEYFADGMTEALITNLARIRALRVISRTSVMRYKGTRKTLPEIGRELDVDGIVEGSVLRAGNKVRITAQLIDAGSDAHLWAEDYERDARDVLSLQGEVARAIAQQVKAVVTPQEVAALAKPVPVDPEAYRLYLLGRFQWNKRSRAGFERARGYFQQAIEKDPTYAAAYVGLADVYTVARSYGIGEPEEAIRLGKAAASKALELDESLAEAHASLASVHWDELNWVEADREFRRAIELNPGYATARQWYAEYLSQRRRFDEALREAQTAEKLDPLSLMVRTAVGGSLYVARQHDRAVAQLLEVLAEQPDFRPALTLLGRVYLQKKKFAAAIAAFEKARSVAENGATLGLLGYGYATAGRRKEATAILGRLNEISTREYVSPMDFATVHTGLGNRDQAFEWLDKAVAERSPQIGDLASDPIFDPLRSDSRFENVLKRIGLSS